MPKTLMSIVFAIVEIKTVSIILFSAKLADESDKVVSFLWLNWQLFDRL